MAKTITKIFTVEFDKNRVYGLDILRAIAILCVLVSHTAQMLPEVLKSIIEDYLEFDGVSLFFVLSGFLIGGILIKIVENQKPNFKTLINFWMRRWFRTLPNYFLILTILVLLQYFFGEARRFEIKTIGEYYLFIQNLAWVHPYWFFPEAWSLSVEEWFYILIPLMIFFHLRASNQSPKYSVLSIIVLVIIAGLVFKIVKFQNVTVEDIGGWDVYFRKQVITRLDSLVIGVLGAFLQFYYSDKWKKNKKVLFFVGLGLILCLRFLAPFVFDFSSFFYCVLYLPLMSIATLLLFPFLSDLKSGEGRIYNIVTRISIISYSLYLVNFSLVRHWLIGNIPWRSFENKYFIVFAPILTFWFITFLLSILLYKYFEKPMTLMREKVTDNKVRIGGSLRSN